MNKDKYTPAASEVATPYALGVRDGEAPGHLRVRDWGPL